MLTEVWKDVKGFEGVYQVSNLGRVKRLPSKIKVNRFNKVIDVIVRERILKPDLTGVKYKRVQLYGLKIKTKAYIHRLVAVAFIENPKQYKFINHKDGNKLNNVVTNLEWCSASDNLFHRSRVLNKSCGSSHYKSKLTDEDVRSIRYLLNQRNDAKSLAIKFNVSRSSISNVKRFITYRNVV